MIADKNHMLYFRCTPQLHKTLTRHAQGILSRSEIIRICVHHVFSLPDKEIRDILYKGAYGNE